MDKISTFREKLTESKNELDIEEVADQYSDGIADYGDFPDEYAAFLFEILSVPLFYTKPGIYKFLSIVGVDTDIMSSKQLRNISDAIIDNYINYNDEILCITACDFIARYYPHKEAEEILLRLKHIEDNKVEKGFADDGLRILINEAKRNRLT